MISTIKHLQSISSINTSISKTKIAAKPTSADPTGASRTPSSNQAVAAKAMPITAKVCLHTCSLSMRRPSRFSIDSVHEAVSSNMCSLQEVTVTKNTMVVPKGFRQKELKFKRQIGSLTATIAL